MIVKLIHSGVSRLATCSLVLMLGLSLTVEANTTSTQGKVSCTTLKNWLSSGQSWVEAEEMASMNASRHAEVFMELFTDEYFIPHFGKSFDRLGHRLLNDIREQITLKKMRLCRSRNAVVAQLLSSPFTFKPFGRARYSGKLSHDTVAAFVERRRDESESGRQPSTAELQEACGAARASHTQAASEISRLRFAVSDSRSRDGRSSSQLVFDRARTLSRKHIEHQRDAKETLKSLFIQARRVSAPAEEKAALLELCEGDGMQVKTLIDRTPLGKRPTGASSDPNIVDLVDNPPRARNPLAIKPRRYESQTATAINAHVVSRCNRMSALFSTAGAPAAVSATSLEPHKGYCRAIIGPVALFYALNIRDLKCTVSSQSGKDCTFETSLACRAKTAFDNGRDDPVVAALCKFEANLWRGATARLGRSDSQTPNVLEVNIQ